MNPLEQQQILYETWKLQSQLEIASELAERLARRCQAHDRAAARGILRAGGIARQAADSVESAAKWIQGATLEPGP